MKPIILPLLAATVLFTACVHSLEPTNSSRGGIISFSSPIIAPIPSAAKSDGGANTSQPAASEAGASTTSQPAASDGSQGVITKSGTTPLKAATSFCVFAMYYPSTFTTWSAGLPFFGVNGDLVSHQSGIHSEDATAYDGWRSANKHYWPNTGTLTFQAYSPAGESLLAGNSISPTVAGDPIIGSTGVEASVTLNKARGEQIDFLVSERILNQTQNTRYPGLEEADPDRYGVQLAFHHALARFNFAAMLRSRLPEGDYIKITHIIVHNAYTSGTFEQNLANNTPGGVLSASSTNWTPTGALGNYDNVAAAVPTELNSNPFGADFADIYLIPQEMDADFKIQVTYEQLKAPDVVPTIHTAYISKTDLAEKLGSNHIDQGKIYNFTLLLGEENKIYFDPLVNPWIDNNLSGHIHYGL